MCKASSTTHIMAHSRCSTNGSYECYCQLHTAIIGYIGKVIPVFSPPHIAASQPCQHKVIVKHFESVCIPFIYIIAFYLFLSSPWKPRAGLAFTARPPCSPVEHKTVSQNTNIRQGHCAPDKSTEARPLVITSEHKKWTLSKPQKWPNNPLILTVVSDCHFFTCQF